MKAFLLLIQLSIRNLWRQRRRNSILLVAVVIAVAGVLNMTAFTSGMLLEVVEASVNNFVGHLKVQHDEFQNDPILTHGFEYEESMLENLDPNQVEGVATRIAVPAVVMSERETRGVQLYGIDPKNEHISLFSDLEIQGQSLGSSDDRGLIIGAELADELRTELGRKLVVMLQDEAGNSQEIGFRITGVFNAFSNTVEKAFVFTGLEALQERLNTDYVTELSVRLKDVEQTEPSASLLEASVPSLVVHTWLSIDVFASTMYLYVDAAIYIMTIIIMGSLVFGLINTFVTAVMERIREFGLLRSVGMQDWQVLIQVLIESTVLMIIGILGGLLLGFLIYLTYADGIDFSAFAEGMEYTGMRPVFKPSMNMNDVLVIVQLSVILGILASLYPARRAMKLSPLEAIKK